MELTYSITTKKKTFDLIKPVYLLYGKEDLLKEEILSKIISSALEPSSKDFNLDSLEGEELDGDILLNLLNTLPLIGKRRVVVVKKSNRLKKEVRVKLLEYLKNPSLSTCLVLFSSGAKRDSSGRMVIISPSIDQAIRKKGELIKCSFSSDYELSSWIKNKVIRSGKKIDPTALPYLISLVGTDLRLLSMEIEKIITYLGEGANISKAEVETVVVPRTESSIFSLIDALGVKGRDKALGFLSSLLRAEEKPSQILFMIARQFRLIWQAKVLGNQGYLSGDYYATSKELKMIPQEVKDILPSEKSILHQPTYIISKCIKQAHYFSQERLCLVIKQLLTTDLTLKNIKGEKEKGLSLELLVLDLCSEERR